MLPSQKFTIKTVEISISIENNYFWGEHIKIATFNIISFIN